jgi:hypothetical protein
MNYSALSTLYFHSQASIFAPSSHSFHFGVFILIRSVLCISTHFRPILPRLDEPPALRAEPFELSKDCWKFYWQNHADFLQHSEDSFMCFDWLG